MRTACRYIPGSSEVELDMGLVQTAVFDVCSERDEANSRSPAVCTAVRSLLDYIFGGGAGMTWQPAAVPMASHGIATAWHGMPLQPMVFVMGKPRHDC